jgi:FMN hydrolase / 5-amino-6-(5-phospho-D-ribitylamino)uracil phosphatase
MGPTGLVVAAARTADARVLPRYPATTPVCRPETVVFSPLMLLPEVTSPSPLRLVPGVVDTLRRLNDHGIVITLSNVTCVEADTDDLGRLLAPWVAGHFPSCRIGYAKPDPRAFRKVAAHYDVEARNMVHIGDDWECDILGATAAGAAAIWISGGRPIPDDRLLVGSDVLVADDLGQVTRQVRTLARRRS